MSIKRKWFASYLVVLLIPILLSFALWYNMHGTINDERVIEGNMRIENIIQRVESEVYLNNLISNYFKSNSLAAELNELNNMSSTDAMHSLYMLSNEISNYCTASGTNNNIYMYFGKTDVIVSRDGVYSPYDFWVSNYSRSNVDFSSWKSILKQNISDYNLYSVNITEDDKTRQSFLHTSRVFQTSELSFTVVAIQGADNVSDKETYNSSLIIYDENDELVYGSGRLPVSLMPELIKSRGNEVIKSGGTHYMISHESSEKTKYRFVVAVELYNAFSGSKLPVIYIFIILSASLLSVWLLWLVFGTNYGFIDDMVKRLMQLRSESSESDDIGMLDNLIDKIVKENRDREKIIKDQKKQLESINVSRLLKGQLKVFESVQEGMAEDERIVFLSDEFVVAVMLIEDCKDFFENESLRDDTKAQELVRFAIENISEEVFSKYGDRVYFSHEESIITLLISPPHEKLVEARGRIYDEIDFIQRFIKQQLKIYMTVSISDMYSGTDKIHSAYEQALELIEYKNIFGEEIIITPENVEISGDEAYAYTEESEGWFINALKMGNAAKAKKMIADVLEISNVQQIMDLKRQLCVSYDIAASIVRYCNEAEIDEIYYDEEYFLEKLFETKNIEKIKELLIEIVEKICKKGKVGVFSDLVRNATKYIDDEYADNSMCLSKIASHFGCHETYLSNIFKEQMGIGILEYTNNRRIHASVELMLTTKLSINEIAEKVGYLSANTYIRVFKKVMGVTPNRYRSMKKERED